MTGGVLELADAHVVGESLTLSVDTSSQAGLFDQGSTLQVSRDNSTDARVNIGSGGLRAVSGASSWTGSVTLTSSPAAGENTFGITVNADASLDISGVISAFRRTALHRIGYWADDMITEDIDISWRLQMDHWDIRYEPRALCFILMPETLKGLWKQRLRWAQGGVEVMLRHTADLLSWRKRRMWLVLFEYLLSVIWAYTMIFIVLLWAIGLFVDMPEQLAVRSILPSWHGVILAMVCLTQFAASLIIDRRYEARVGRNYYWMIWYPIAYWILSLLTTVTAVPKTLLKRRRQRATWVSPDRGLR